MPMDRAEPGYSGVGATLRVARERAGADAVQVAKTLRMQAAHLLAIEQGRFGELPGQVYAIGFVRSYAEYLGFDGDAAVRRLKEEMSGEVARQSPLTFPVPVGEARTPGPRLLLFAIVAAAAIYGAWVYWGRVQTGVVELVPPLPERLAKLLGEAPASVVPSPGQAAPATAGPAPAIVAPAPVIVAPAPKAPPVVAPAPPPEVAPTSSPAPAPAPVAAPAQAIPALPAAPPLVAAAPVGAEVLPPAPPRPPAQAEPPAQSVAALPVPSAIPTVPAEPAAQAPAGPVAGNVFGVPAAESRVTLRAKSISWVQVRGGDNEILITRTLRAGDVYHLPNRADMVMMTGSAGGLDILVDGKPVPPFGAAGEVRRNIPLDPEKLVRHGTGQ